jgi:hypothetical protein
MKDTRLVTLIEAKKVKALEVVAKRENSSVAEVVRKAIDAYLEQRR